MEITRLLYTLFVLLVATGRIIETTLSRRHQQALASRGVEKVHDPNFVWMVLFHTGFLAACVLEVWFLNRPFIPLLAIPMIILFILANGVRWWVIRTLSDHWNVQIMNSVTLGVVTAGPYRYIRHPNYAAVFVELLSIALIHTAWLTAILGTLVHVFVLRYRIQLEDSVLLSNSDYQAAMGSKPRFIPDLW